MDPTRESSLPHGAGARISFSGLCSIAAVLAVVIVVSVPRLGRIALAENDSDARVTARFLADALAGSEEPVGAARLLDLPGVRGTLSDARPLPQGGTALAYHGYLFEVVELPRGWLLETAPGEPQASRVSWAVRARPGPAGKDLGRTYLARPDGSTFALAPGAPEDDPRAWRRVD